MTLVIGVAFGAVLLGLFVPRWRPLHWAILILWIAAVVAYFYFKNR